jgi:hypothetical protein
MIPNAFQQLLLQTVRQLQNFRKRASTGRMNAVKAQGSPIPWTSLSRHNRALSRDVMLERMEKFKHFFISFLAEALAKSGVMVS